MESPQHLTDTETSAIGLAARKIHGTENLHSREYVDALGALLHLVDEIAGRAACDARRAHRENAAAAVEAAFAEVTGRPRSSAVA